MYKKLFWAMLIGAVLSAGVIGIRFGLLEVKHTELQSKYDTLKKAYATCCESNQQYMMEDIKN